MASHHTKIEIPQRLKAILETDENLHSAVQRSIQNFKDWIIDNKVVFFREYTDHGPRHIETVMANIEGLIAKETWDANILTPADAAVMTLAVLLHDCAMHLTEEGFLRLIRDESGCRPIASFGDKAWSELWAEFLREAKRFDTKTDRNVFGDDKVARSIPVDVREWQSAHYRLIGEFVRRHHPRLAHQIAVGSVPGVADKEPIQLDPHLTSAQRDLIGLVARSHGISLRSAIEPLRAKRGRAVYLGVHAPFLMALLRVGDYLELEADRAPADLLSVKSLRSPLSRREWAGHSAIAEFQPDEDDPDAIYMVAHPQAVEQYLHVKGWQSGIQSELDTSWAVLGEVYGRRKQEKWNLFALKLRRLRSNLDDEKTFKATNPDANYVPRKAAFHTDSTQLLPLLVRPLYQDDPGIGIRELLQNAVDAVNEMEEYLRRHPERKDKITRKQQEADILVTMEKDETGQHVLTVSDNGIGMNVDVICNYFLRVGASFRKSDVYTQEFVDDDGHSRILRSGKFGVGVLAAFLLGDSLEVTTRHADELHGITFTATLNAETIPLTSTNCEVGTTIRIAIRSQAMLNLKQSEAFHWYCLTSPSVSMYLDKIRISDYFGTLTQSELLQNWHKFEVNGYNVVRWNYHEHNAPGIICNGILGCTYPEIWLLAQLRLSCPSVYVEDADGNLPMTLDRRRIEGRLPFERELAIEVIRDWLAYLLVNLPSLNFQNNAFVLDATLLESLATYPGLHHPNTHNHTFNVDSCVSPFYWNKKGIVLSSSENLLNVYSLLVISKLDLSPDYYHMLKTFEEDINNENILFVPFTEPDPDVVFDIIGKSGISGFRICIARSQPFVDKRLSHVVSEQQLLNDFTWGIGQCSTPSKLFSKVVKSIAKKGTNPNFSSTLPVVAEAYISATPFELSEGHELFADVWRDIIREPIIPYNLDERKQKLSHAYEVLRPYIEKHEAIRAEKERKSGS